MVQPGGGEGEGVVKGEAERARKAERDGKATRSLLGRAAAHGLGAERRKDLCRERAQDLGLAVGAEAVEDLADGLALRVADRAEPIAGERCQRGGSGGRRGQPRCDQHTDGVGARTHLQRRRRAGCRR